MATALLEYKCPCCGGAIEFDSSLQKMKCPYCDTEFEVEALKELDEALKQEQPDDMLWESQAGDEWREDEMSGLRSYICNSCGGEIIGDETLGASNCPFCGNPVVMVGQFAGDLKPNYVIPFKLDKNAAKEGLVKYLKGKKLLPKVFKEENHIDEIKGIYVPFWLFDTDTNADIRYKATRVKRWSTSDYDYTQISYYTLQRGGSLSFQRVPVDGSSHIPDELMESIEPYDFMEAVPFQTPYLAGYLADKYDVSADDSIERANQRIKQSTESVFASTAKDYATVVPESSSVRLSNSNISYALYPVWILNTTWRDKKYTFAMNGQTGKFVGDLPLDKGAFAKWWAILTAAFSVSAFVISMLTYIFLP